MVQNVKSNKAFTLIELMVALTIILICVVALMETSVVVMRNNLRNEIRNKAISTLNNHIRDLTNKDYKYIQPVTGTTYFKTDTDNETIRNFQQTFTISDNITKNTSTNGKYITSKISWVYRGKTYDYTINTVVNKQ